jgi:hypothetical protein
LHIGNYPAALADPLQKVTPSSFQNQEKIRTSSDRIFGLAVVAKNLGGEAEFYHNWRHFPL